MNGNINDEPHCLIDDGCYVFQLCLVRDDGKSVHPYNFIDLLLGFTLSLGIHCHCHDESKDGGVHLVELLISNIVNKFTLYLPFRRLLIV